MKILMAMPGGNDLLRFHFQVEHIVREENMMAAQEIIELFCELIAVRLPIIESQRFQFLIKQITPLVLYYDFCFLFT